jgi:hypothetical protein
MARSGADPTLARSGFLDSPLAKNAAFSWENQDAEKHIGKRPETR